MSVYSSAVLADSPDVYYRLDETSGTAIADSSGNGRGLVANAAISGAAASLLSGDPDGAILFDYAANAPTLAQASPQFFVAQDGMTVEFWIKPTSLVTSAAAVAVIVCSGNGPGTQGWAAYFTDTTGVWHFIKQNVADYVFNTAAPAAVGTTQHMAFVVAANGLSVDLYQNGVLAQSRVTAAMVAASAGTFVIANNITGTTHNPKAVIDEVAVYKSALSAGRIAAHFAASSQVASLHTMALLGVGS